MKFNRNPLSESVCFGLVAGLAAAVVAPAAFAQDATEDAEAKTLDRIEVTGSRLKRADIEGAVPVIVIDRASIDASGVWYSGALKFEHRRNLLWEEMTRHGYDLPAEARVVRYHRGQGLPHGPGQSSLKDTRD